jgi:hypothetical protein
MRYREIFGEERSAVRGAWGIAKPRIAPHQQVATRTRRAGSDFAQPIRKRLRPEAKPDPAVARQLIGGCRTHRLEGSRPRDQ